MKTWVRRSLNAGALTAGALLATGAAAQASPMVSTDNTGALNGTQALIPIQAPINLCGNAIGVAGGAFAGCEGGATALNSEWGYDYYRSQGGSEMTSTGNVGALNGTQVKVPVQVPVNVCGNAVAVLGAAGAGCEGGADAKRGPKQRPGYDQPDNDRPGHDRPGHDRPDHDRPGHDDPDHHGHGYDQPEHSGGNAGGWGSGGGSGSGATGDPTMFTSGNVGLLNGTQVLVPVQVPIDICGNAIGVLGVAHAECEGGSTAKLGY
jgi:hypothetical protein